MSLSTPAIAKSSSPLDIKRTPLAIRSLDKRRTSIDRIRTEFTEMRGFSPTLAQAARLFDLTADECARVLAVLIQDGSLRKGEDGRYRLA